MPPRSDREPGQTPSDEQRVDALAQGAAQAANAAEHERLLEAAGAGDHAARESLTKAHLDWVLAAAQERANRGLSQGDLFQEGTIGLLEAIEHFPASGRGDFESYAREQVARQMDRALGDEERVVRDGQLLLQAAQDYVQAEFTVRREIGRSPTDAELAERLEWSVERTQEIGQMVADARRRHDEEILQYLEPGDIELESLMEDRQDGDGG